jgi:fumarylpyruvate hydrolase
MTDTAFAFQPLPKPTVPILDQPTRFPVGRIFCIGRNYAEHAKEMGSPAEPIFFMKPADAITLDTVLPFPPATSDLHHEVELVLALGEDAQIMACGVGVDLTRRDLQARMKAKGAPWEIGKSFAQSAPIGPLKCGSAPVSGAIQLSVNGAQRQMGDLADMILSADQILEALSHYFTLQPGDLIYTGTPAGVGPLQPGDRVSASIAGLPSLDFSFSQD